MDTNNVGTPGLNMLANHVLREGGDMTVPQTAKLMQNWRPGPSSSAIGQIANMALSSEAQKLLAQGGAKTQMLSGTVCFLFVLCRCAVSVRCVCWVRRALSLLSDFRCNMLERTLPDRDPERKEGALMLRPWNDVWRRFRG